MQKHRFSRFIYITTFFVTKDLFLLILSLFKPVKKALFWFEIIIIIMGNQNNQFLPKIIAKNWSVLSPGGDIFVNKLTN